MVVTLENSFYKVEISTSGAEIQSFVRKSDSSDIIWHGDHSVWARHAPILFPFISRCVGGFYIFDGKRVDFTKNHGFARDVEHKLVYNDEKKGVFELSYDDELLEKFPYKFLLRTVYELDDKGLDWKLEVINCDDKTFGFHIGTHPAFACKPSECFIEFEKKSFLKGIKCTKEGYLAPLIDGELDLYDFGEKEAGIIPVPAEGFGNGVFVLNNDSDWVCLHDRSSNHSVKIESKVCKYIMLWQNVTGEGQFVCVEPWYGVQDPVNSDNIWSHKYDLINLNKGESFSCSQRIFE